MTVQSTNGTPYASGAMNSSQVDAPNWPAIAEVKPEVLDVRTQNVELDDTLKLEPLISDETKPAQENSPIDEPTVQEPGRRMASPLHPSEQSINKSRQHQRAAIEHNGTHDNSFGDQQNGTHDNSFGDQQNGSTHIEKRRGDAMRRPTDAIEAAQHNEESPMRAGRYSIFNVALAIFIVANMMMSFAQPIEFDKFKFPYQGWAWWTFNDLRNSSEEHNVALLGSSLMVSAVNNSDAMYMQKELNLAKYHNAVYLDKLLADKFGGTFKTYNLAAPGQMPSDAYMTLHAMLKTHQRPDVVVYGVAPRDFYDSSMDSPVDTEPFKFLHRLVNLDDSWNKLFKSPFDKLNFILERDVYLYGNALDISMVASEKLEAFLNKYAPAPYGRGVFTYWDRIKLLPGYKPGEIHPLAVVAPPQDPNKPPTFQDNTPEYRERYKNPDPKNYNIQHYFLKKLVELCKRERIELVIVNMPITLENIRVLGSYRYMGYVNSLRTLNKGMMRTFDLNDFALYSLNDYADGVHLNAFGGNKLFKQLVEIMNATYRTRLALEASGHHLARRKAIADQHIPDPDTFKTDIPL